MEYSLKPNTGLYNSILATYWVTLLDYPILNFLISKMGIKSPTFGGILLNEIVNVKDLVQCLTNCKYSINCYYYYYQ